MVHILECSSQCNNWQLLLLHAVCHTYNYKKERVVLITSEASYSLESMLYAAQYYTLMNLILVVSRAEMMDTGGYGDTMTYLLEMIRRSYRSWTTSYSMISGIVLLTQVAVSVAIIWLICEILFKIGSSPSSEL